MILKVNFLDKAVSFDEVIDIPCLCKVKDNIFFIITPFKYIIEPI